MSQNTNHPGHDDHKEITVETLRTPPLRIQPAPIQKRIIAGLIDSAIVGLVWLMLTVALRQQTEAQIVVSAGYLAGVTFAYYFLQEYAFATTIGKHLLRLRVVEMTGDPPSVRDALIRNFLRFVDWLPVFYILGTVIIAISRDKRRFGDIAAGTVVTLAPEKDINPPPAPFLFH